MSDRKPLMPKATAVWLVENTSLTFEQIAEFCGLHVLEVKGIADGDVAQGIKGLDPVTSGQLTREEIEAAEQDPLPPPQDRRAQGGDARGGMSKKGPRYTPVSRRHDRPNAVLWLLRNHPELKNSQIMRLVGTTKPTIAQIKDRTHWNSPNLVPQDPVTLGLCSQIDLDAEVKKAARRVERERKEARARGDQGRHAAADRGDDGAASRARKDLRRRPRSCSRRKPRRSARRRPAEEEARVFAKLKELKETRRDRGGRRPKARSRS